MRCSHLKKVYLLLTMLFVTCFTGYSVAQESIFAVNVAPVRAGNRYRPGPGSSWQWQLSGRVNTEYDVEIYDLDLFDTDQAVIESLQKDGKKVICYFSAGSYEDWRADKDDFPADLIGKALDGWPDERWLDIRDDRLARIMRARLDLAVQKGCDGVEPDNVDGYLNTTGFDLHPDDQLAYNKFIANEAGKRGLAVGLKNDLEQIAELEPYFDFGLTEQCYEYNECDKTVPFILKSKPVFNAEYKQEFIHNSDGARDLVCADAKRLHLKTLVLPVELDDSFRYSCN